MLLHAQTSAKKIGRNHAEITLILASSELINCTY